MSIEEQNKLMQFIELIKNKPLPVSVQTAMNTPMSKAEFFRLDWDEQDRIQRKEAAYGPAMTAMRAHEKLMRDCTCEWDGDQDPDGTMHARRTPPKDTPCPVHAEEDEGNYDVPDL